MTSLSPAQQALLAQRLRGRSIARPGAVARAIPPVPTEPVPVSAEQRQIVYHTYFAPGNPIYNEAITIAKAGPLDVDALRAAFEAFVARHDIWHTTFRRIERQPHQIVGESPTFALDIVDLSSRPSGEREAIAAELVAEQALRPYDLKSGPLVRPLLVRFADDDHRLYLAMHHIVFDGVSLYRVVLPELVALYDAAVAGRASPLPPAVQYTQYATWQASGVLDAELERNLPYWRELLADAPTLALPITGPRPTEPRFHGTTEWFVLPADLTDRLRSLGTDSGATLFHVLVGAYALLLQHYGGQDDIVFSTVADLRRRREFESMVGYCLTPVPIRLKFAPELPFDELVRLVRDELLDSLGRLVPFERLVDALKPPHEPGANPVFQAQLVLEPPAAVVHPEWSLHQLDARIGQGLGHAKTDFHMELDQRPEGHISGRFIFNTDLFERDFGARVVADWLTLLGELTAQPTSSR